MQTKFMTLAGIFGVITGLCFSTNQNILFSIGTALVASAFGLAAYFSRDKKDKQIEEIHSATTNNNEPLKIVIVDNTVVYKVKFDIVAVDWSKFIAAITTNPFVPEQLKATIQSEGIDSFLLIDLENKKLISKPPKTVAELNTKAIALAHKDFLADFTIDLRARTIFAAYVADNS